MRTSHTLHAIVAAGLTLAITALVPASAEAGYYLEHEAVLPNPQQPTQPIRATIRSWHDGKKFKRESPMRGEFVVIDLSKGKVWGINDDKRTYWEMPGNKYRQLALMSLMVMGVQPTQSGDLLVPKGLFKKTGQKGEIAGRKAYEVTVQGNLPQGMSTTFWLSEDIPIPMSKMVDELKAALGDPKEPGFKDLFKQWLALDGYPVQSVTTINMPTGRMITSETLLVYRDEKIDPTVFEVPKGYALVKDPLTEAEEMMRAQMQKQQPLGIGAPLQPTKR
jgi:hypothetical protein